MVTEKMNFIHNEKIDPTEILPEMVDKLHINEDDTSNDVTDKLMQKATTQKEITKPEHNSKRMTIPSYNIDGMSFQDLQISLRRIKKTSQQPFSFLANIYEIFNDENQLAAKATKPTKIDIQLAAVAKRIESNRALLEEAKSRVNEIHLRVKRDAAMPQRSLHTQNVSKLEKQP